MFREMRKVGIELNNERAAEILLKNKHGVLSVSGDDDYPYGVPLSYFYDDNKIYFHCNPSGHKMDSLRKHPKVSFCVIEQDNIMPEAFTTIFISAIAFGKARIVKSNDEKKAILLKIMGKYSGDFMESAKKYIEEEFDNCCVVEITIDHLTAKEGN